MLFDFEQKMEKLALTFVLCKNINVSIKVNWNVVFQIFARKYGVRFTVLS